MDVKERILRSENEAAKAFASFIEKDYGILYYNDNNKESHDSNHANLYTEKIADLEQTLTDIKEFYLSRGIVPRIYHPLTAGYFENNRSVFERTGFEVRIYGNNRYMLLTEENKIDVEKRLVIKRLLEWDERIASDILIPNNEEYEIDVIKNLLKHQDSFLFVGYLDDVAVTTTYLHVCEYDCTSFDYIVTAKNHRNKGYAREILSYVVDFCRQNNLHNCYQWPAHKTSEEICYEAGFRLLFEIGTGAAVYTGNGLNTK